MNTSEDNKKNNTTHFGFKEINAEEKINLVKNVFTNVSKNYNLMNDLMSGGLHRIWKDEFVHLAFPQAGQKILDAGGGTGDIAFRLSKATNHQAQITVADINQDMLDEGKKLSINHGIIDNLTWDQANLEELPYEDNTFDLCTIAFCIRNVTDIQKALDEMYRVLKPGARFLCLEFSEVNLPVLKEMYDMYSFNVIPKIGKYVAKDEESYKYLVESIRQFPAPDDFEQMLQNSGFHNTKYKRLSGGICAIHMGKK